MQEVEERDHLRNFQPVFTGQHIMYLFGLAPGPEVGRLKVALREAILDNKIQNTEEDSFQFVLETGKKLGFTAVQNRTT